MKKLSNGVTNYEDLIRENRIYVDKTMYIEKMENLPDKAIMFLRPRKFGKTLFTSVLENYYDKNKADEFEFLYKDTYIGKHPTELRNKYSILRFNFSGINTENEEATMNGFKEKITISIEGFIKTYGIDFYINPEQTVEGMTRSLIEAFKLQKNKEKIYVIIDEYDHFANELLGFHPEHFKNLVSKNGKVRKWYEVLKEGAETVIDRIFITGVAPITLDSLTSGFNISKDISQDIRFNDMMGFTKNELIEVLNIQKITEEEQEKIMPIMKENYDGYKLNLNAKNHIYNSNMCLYFLSEYTWSKEIPDKLVDVNIASDYSKICKIIDWYKNKGKLEEIKKVVKGDTILTDIIEKFNPEMEFNERYMTSMLYYTGYLTIFGEKLGLSELTIPNKVINKIFTKKII